MVTLHDNLLDGSYLKRSRKRLFPIHFGRHSVFARENPREMRMIVKADIQCDTRNGFFGVSQQMFCVIQTNPKYVLTNRYPQRPFEQTFKLSH